MAEEVTVSCALSYSDSEHADLSLVPDDFVGDVTTKKYTRLKQNIGTAEEAIKLGEITSIGWAIFINRDPTNYIELRVATAGAKFATLKANGGFALLYMGSGAQVPYAIANTAACQMEILLVSQ